MVSSRLKSRNKRSRKSKTSRKRGKGSRRVSRRRSKNYKKVSRRRKRSHKGGNALNSWFSKSKMSSPGTLDDFYSLHSEHLRNRGIRENNMDRSSRAQLFASVPRNSNKISAEQLSNSMYNDPRRQRNLEKLRQGVKLMRNM